nr:MAG TPA: hypothetical protein [Caudoviricetes sp.]
MACVTACHRNFCSGVLIPKISRRPHEINGN